jgi:hypothetical protein
MKIAVIVYGMYREFDIAVKSWDFLNRFDCDVYFSTWSKSLQKNKKLGIIINEDVNEERILRHIPNAKISIIDDNFDDLLRSEKMIFHWKRALDMLLKSSIKYDYIILSRSDNYIHFNIDENFIKNTIQSDKIYGLAEMEIINDYEVSIQDIFFMGKFEEIKKIIESIPSNLCHEEFDGSIHYHLAKHILLNKLTVEVLPNVEVVVVRGNARELTPNEINIDNLAKKHNEWGENWHQYHENNI